MTATDPDAVEADDDIDWDRTLAFYYADGAGSMAAAALAGVARAILDLGGRGWWLDDDRSDLVSARAAAMRGLARASARTADMIRYADMPALTDAVATLADAAQAAVTLADPLTEAEAAVAAVLLHAAVEALRGATLAELAEVLGGLAYLTEIEV